VSKRFPAVAKRHDWAALRVLCAATTMTFDRSILDDIEANLRALEWDRQLFTQHTDNNTDLRCAAAIASRLAFKCTGRFFACSL
jgi:hypothetical protein